MKCNVHHFCCNADDVVSVDWDLAFETRCPDATATCFSIVWATALNVYVDFGVELTILKTCTFPEQLTVKFTHAPSEGEISFE